MATAAEIERLLNRAIEVVTGEISAGVIVNAAQATRRDTGYHASRWVGRAGSPPQAIDTPRTREGRAAALSLSQQAGSIAALRNYRLVQGNTVFVGNDGNYIEALERRDPFVGDAIARSIRALNGRTFS